MDPAGVVDLLNDILMPPLSTAPAIGAPDLVCVIPNGDACYEWIIRDEDDRDLSFDAQRMPNCLQRGLHN